MEQNRSLISRWSKQDQLNFLLANRIPRRLATQFVGWLSRIENPLVTSVSMAIWRLFSDDFRFEEAETTDFKSIQDCFIRKLKAGVRPINEEEDVIVSPCDAIVGAHGRVQGTTVYQTKGFPYSLEELLPDKELVERYRDGVFVTLRLKSNMYHRFHAPCNGEIREVTYISGDTWNVNPVALKRVEKLYCKNERAVVTIHRDGSEDTLTLVPVAAILVASMKFSFLEGELDLRSRGANKISCIHRTRKGNELGYFQHGSTIIVFGTSGFRFCEGVGEGMVIRMGEALLEVSE